MKETLNQLFFKCIKYYRKTSGAFQIFGTQSLKFAEIESQVEKNDGNTKKNNPTVS